MSLESEGFRFVYRDPDWMWVHPTLTKQTDVDCTDMTDAEFEAFVEAATNREMNPA